MNLIHRNTQVGGSFRKHYKIRYIAFANGILLVVSTQYGSPSCLAINRILGIDREVISASSSSVSSQIGCFPSEHDFSLRSAT